MFFNIFAGAHTIPSLEGILFSKIVLSKNHNGKIGRSQLLQRRESNVADRFKKVFRAEGGVGLQQLQRAWPPSVPGIRKTCIFL